MKVSFRSTGEVDVNAFARQFGGGGHAKASGALIAGSLAEVRERVIAAAREFSRHPSRGQTAQGTIRMAPTLQQRIAQRARQGASSAHRAHVAESDAIRDLATTTTGKVRLTLLLAPGDDPALARVVRQALENVEGVTDVQIAVGDATASHAPPPPKPSRTRASGDGRSAGGAAARAGTDSRSRIPNLGRIIAVSSGKGGVGKSTVSVNLAVALAAQGARVATHGRRRLRAEHPAMMGVNEPPMVVNEKIMPLEAHGVKVMSLGFLIDRDQPAIWRGPIVMKIITQFLRDVRVGTARLLHRRHAAGHRRRAALARAGDAGPRRHHRHDAAGSRRWATRCAA